VKASIETQKLRRLHTFININVNINILIITLGDHSLKGSIYFKLFIKKLTSVRIHCLTRHLKAAFRLFMAKRPSNLCDNLLKMPRKNHPSLLQSFTLFFTAGSHAALLSCCDSSSSAPSVLATQAFYPRSIPSALATGYSEIGSCDRSSRPGLGSSSLCLPACL
jgi:hypothetical protein